METYYKPLSSPASSRVLVKTFASLNMERRFLKLYTLIRTLVFTERKGSRDAYEESYVCWHKVFAVIVVIS